MTNTPISPIDLYDEVVKALTPSQFNFCKAVSDLHCNGLIDPKDYTIIGKLLNRINNIFM